MNSSAANSVFVGALSANLEQLGRLRNASEDDVRAWLLNHGVKLGGMPVRRAACTALRSGEIECAGGWHTLQGGGAVRCALAHLSDRRHALAHLLQACGIPKDFDEQAHSLSAALLAKIDGTRRVEGLPNLIAVVEDAVREPLRANTALVGSCGTAKTAGLLAIYFAALALGLRAFWLNSQQLREVAQRCDSLDQIERQRGHGQRQAWTRAQLLVLDDLGDRIAPRGADVQGLLTDLTSCSAALAWSSNLDDEEGRELRKHPDLGVRIVSRLFADRGSEPCRVATVKGDDQRQHAMRSAQRRSTAGDWRTRAAGGRP